MNENPQDSPSLEQELHDQWASEINPVEVDPRLFFEASTSPENRFIMQCLGDVHGKRVLDLGCGYGESAVYFALMGADVTAVDISEGMVKALLEVASANGISIEARTMNAMDLDYPDGSFDIVYAANILHHVEPEAALKEMRRVLRPGGKACFWDPLGHNPENY
ncbi:hypothetical protein LCGC14_1718480 [marine sediment metagenome]|uniref:Methyltransferase type 11 domain-containing protein n=1 Tax=marine sediment metagenome TaxID=412755 RepID=A0A0F9HDF0_9ZZZZ